VVAGLSYAVRYPGLFLVAGAVVYLIVRAWRVPPARRGALAGLLAAAAIAGSIQIRNIVYTGSWRGGFEAGGRQALRTIVTGTVGAFLHLVTGDRVPLRFNIRLAILPLAAALAVFVWARFVPNAAKSGDTTGKGIHALRGEPLGWTLFIALVYIGGILLAAITTIAGDFPRYFFPVYPLLLACAAAACSSIADRWRSLVVVLIVVSVISVEARSLGARPDTPDWVLTRGLLTEEVQPGVPLLQWLRNQLSPEGTLLAVEGQAVHYLLQRPVVAVLPAEFSARQLDEGGFHSLMVQFRSRYLLLLPGAPSERIPDENSYTFLKSIASGTVPPWLTLAAHTRDAAVYECLDCLR